MSIYWYFVAFSFVTDGMRAWGNTEVPTPQRVETIEDVRLMQFLLEERYHGDVLIVNYQLLRTEENPHDGLLMEIRIAQTILEKAGIRNETMSSV